MFREVSEVLEMEDIDREIEGEGLYNYYNLSIIFSF